MNPAHRYLNRLCNRPDVHAEQWATPTRHGYMAVYEPITDALLENHFLGITTLGVYTTSAENTCKWICWDFDEEQEDAVDRLRLWLDSRGISSLRESMRQGRSGHIWVFIESPIRSADAYNLACYARFCSEAHCEVYPVQSELVNPLKPGNLVRLPLGVNQKPSAKNWGLFDACPSKDITTQLFWFLSQPLNSAEHVLSVCATLPHLPAKPKRRVATARPEGELLSNFPDDWPFKDTQNGELEGLCPVCHELGFDTQCSNLSLNPAANVMFCHRNSGEHTFIQILNSLKKLKQGVLQ